MPIRVIPSFQAPQIATQPVDLAGAFLGPIAAGQAMAQARQRAEREAVAAQLAEQLAPLRIQQEQLQLQALQRAADAQVAAAPIQRVLQELDLRARGLRRVSPEEQQDIQAELEGMRSYTGAPSSPTMALPGSPSGIGTELLPIPPLERPILTDGFVFEPQEAERAAQAKSNLEATQKIRETELMEEAKARGKARGEAGAPIKLDKTVTETKVLWTNPNTGEVVKSLDIDPSKKYFNTEAGVRVVGADGKMDFIADPVTAGKGAKLKPLSEAERNSLLSLSGQKGFLSDIVTDYDKLNAGILGGKVGPLQGRFQAGKAWLGFGDKEFKTANAQIRANLFSSARVLQGAGVLTEKDIDRMEEIAPTLKENREGFVGGVEGMRNIMLKRATAFKDVNYSRLNPDEKTALDSVISQLSIAVDETPSSTVPSGSPRTAAEFLKKYQ